MNISDKHLILYTIAVAIVSSALTDIFLYMMGKIK